MVIAQRGYAGPGAFRRALTDHLKANAAQGRWTLAQLQRQLAYDRLLERLYLLDDGWIVKGATALLARDLGMRATIDVDVYREQVAPEAEVDLRAAVGREIGDWFRFEVGPGRPIGEGENGVRLPVTAATRLDRRAVTLLLAAIAHATGSHEHRHITHDPERHHHLGDHLMLLVAWPLRE